MKLHPLVLATALAFGTAAPFAAAVDGVVSVDNQLVVAAEGTALRTEANTATASGEVRAATEDATDGVDEEGDNPSLSDLDGDGVDEVGPGPDAEVNDRVGTGTGVALDADDVDTDGHAVVDNDADLDTDVDADAAVDGTADIDADATPGDAVDDAWITSKVKTQLLADEAVNGLDIDVDTNANVVTLNGTVETATARAEAVRIARATSGVKEVVDNLTVASD